MGNLTEKMAITQQVVVIREKIAIASKSPLAHASGVCLLAASKSQGFDAIEEAIGAGIVDFGENRVQEAEDKWLSIKAKYPHVRLHLIGALQSNKVKEAVALFDVIQTVDRVKLADALAAEMGKQQRSISCYIQVNIGAEEQKAGVSVDEAPQLLAHCRGIGLVIEGLMCVPPVGQHPAPHFALLAKMAAEMGLSGLSMGMSDDYEIAVRMGASCVRVGRVLFGDRV